MGQGIHHKSGLEEVPKQTGQDRSGRQVWSKVDNGQTKRNKEQLEHDGVEQEEQDRSGGLWEQLQWEVEAAEVHGTEDKLVRQLVDELSNQQGGPVVSVGLGLSNLEQLSGVDGSGLDLVDQWGGNDNGEEGRKHGVLQTDNRIFDGPEGEPNKQTSRHHQHHLGHHVLRRSVELDTGSSDHIHQLGPVRNSKGVVQLLVVSHGHTVFGLDGLQERNFLGGGLELFRGLPNVKPVLLDRGSGTGTDGFQDVLGRILMSLTLSGTVSLKVTQDVSGVLTNVTKVHGLPTFSQQQQTIKGFKQSSRRLVDDVQILLLDIPGGSLESGIQRLTVDQEITSDGTEIDSLRQDVQQRGLTSTRLTHQSSQSTRLDVTLNVVQQLSGSSLVWNDIVDVLPDKSTSGTQVCEHVVHIIGSGGSVELVQLVLLFQPVGTSFRVVFGSLQFRVQDHIFLHDSSTSLEVQLVAATLDGSLVLSDESIDGNEEDQESNKEPQISPHVAVMVAELDPHIVVTRNRGLANLRTDKGTDLIRSRHGFVTRTTWN
ncbi:hypothetical protein WICPIJ_009030 [Wickerhamomyces pijperi]|uniref:Uncharacterized protein n=1 Tax=Wickerhamomyces pijperi TaxID=599730 RepID=A0A9P8TFN8_WICPI|nr:hypothetical protein WICPIJ_009030 [Wickerhamomyces pijperi]